MTAICPHVPYDADHAYMVTAGTPRLHGLIEVRCPCCGIRAYQDPGDRLDEGPPCPYCFVQPVPA